MERTRGIRTDIINNDDHYLLEAELPGFKKDEIAIDLKNDILSISATKAGEENEGGDDKNYIRRERFEVSYQRAFKVRDVKNDEISASYEDGILKITLPKKDEIVEKNEAKKIEIQ